AAGRRRDRLADQPLRPDPWRDRDLRYLTRCRHRHGAPRRGRGRGCAPGGLHAVLESPSGCPGCSARRAFLVWRRWRARPTRAVAGAGALGQSCRRVVARRSRPASRAFAAPAVLGLTRADAAAFGAARRRLGEYRVTALVARGGLRPHRLAYRPGLQPRRLASRWANSTRGSRCRNLPNRLLRSARLVLDATRPRRCAHSLPRHEPRRRRLGSHHRRLDTTGGSVVRTRYAVDAAAVRDRLGSADHAARRAAFGAP